MIKYVTFLFRCFRCVALGGFCFGRRFTGPAGGTCDFWNIDDRGLHRRSLAFDLSRFGWRCFDGCCDHDRDRCGFRVLRGTLFLLSRNLCWRDVRCRTLISCPVIARTITAGPFVAGPVIAALFAGFVVAALLRTRCFRQFNQPGFIVTLSFDDFGFLGRSSIVVIALRAVVATFAAIVTVLSLPVTLAALAGLRTLTGLTALRRLLILLPLFLFGCHLAHRFAQHAGVVFSVLHEILGSDSVI